MQRKQFARVVGNFSKADGLFTTVHTLERRPEEEEKKRDEEEEELGVTCMQNPSISAYI